MIVRPEDGTLLLDGARSMLFDGWQPIGRVVLLAIRTYAVLMAATLLLLV